MIVLQLVNCPNRVKGEVTKWLFEVSSGLYVGNVSARVRDELWKYVCNELNKGRAVMVYPANTEQRYDFRICGDTWTPVDYDGLKLMLRPSAKYMAQKQAVQETKAKLGFSKASKMRQARKFQK